ncbi:MAG: Cys-tRNA(Pro) deacylase [Bacillota bacterium]|nr:Cys-tRNA(Pro) deacylase [Bacillota bacterium]
MAKEKEPAKTNAMRLLDGAGIEYRSHSYDASDGHIDGEAVADKIGRSYEQVYKTLVSQGPGPGQYFVFVIPVDQELDLKKAAKAAGVKSIQLAPVKDLTKLTGYVRGGCSPIGMKKPFPTWVDESAVLLETMVFSGGRIGCQIECRPDDLLGLIGGNYAELC